VLPLGEALVAFSLPEVWVHLLYVDESGDVENPGEHFVLGGVALHESDLLHMRRRVERIVNRYLYEHVRGIELHAKPIRTGSGAWGRIPKPVKAGLLRDVPRLLGSFVSPSGHPYALFAVAKAPGAIPGADPLERSFEELLLRFTQMLVRQHDELLLGLVVADKAKYEKTLQPIVSRWRESGTRFSKLTRLVEVPLFVDSGATRLTQLADFVAHAVFRYYQADDASLITPMLPAFDADGGVMHGLVHLTSRRGTCGCMGCVTRRDALRAARSPR